MQKFNTIEARLPNPNGLAGPRPLEGQATFQPANGSACKFYKIASLEQLKFRAQTIIRLQLATVHEQKALACEDPAAYRAPEVFCFKSHPMFVKANEAYKSAMKVSLCTGMNQEAVKADPLTDEQQRLVLALPDMNPNDPKVCLSTCSHAYVLI